ncbi:MAG TPA: hypothetical protein VFP27_02145, partial [Mycobacterium sp.]|nr:hypothetical protein [Mycobacterium sp.]
SSDRGVRSMRLHSTRRWQGSTLPKSGSFQIKAALRAAPLGVTEQPVLWALADEVESGVGAEAFGGF